MRRAVLLMYRSKGQKNRVVMADPSLPEQPTVPSESTEKPQILIVEFRNGESALHVQRIRTLTECILEWLSMNPGQYLITNQQQDIIPLASALHDIGKIGIPDSILNGECGVFNPRLMECLRQIEGTLQQRLDGSAVFSPQEKI